VKLRRIEPGGGKKGVPVGRLGRWRILFLSWWNRLKVSQPASGIELQVDHS
jgi:hypothetical protein